MIFRRRSSRSRFPSVTPVKIYEKFAQWTDSNRNPESVLSTDEMLDDIMLFPQRQIPSAADPNSLLRCGDNPQD
jgi:hypothetical protein